MNVEGADTFVSLEPFESIPGIPWIVVQVEEQAQFLTIVAATQRYVWHVASDIHLLTEILSLSCVC